MSRILIVLFVFFNHLSFSQIVMGKITDNSGKVIPYARICVSDTAKGTVSDAEGFYQLELKIGTYLIETSAEGFEKKTDEIYVTTETTIHNPVLTAKAKDIEEVTISYVDPKSKGKAIMKKVIEKRPYFRALMSEYSCNTYCFASLEREKRDSLVKDSVVGKEKVKVMEWKARSFFKEIARFKDEFQAFNDFRDDSRYVGFGSGGDNKLNLDGKKASIVTHTEEGGDPYLFVNGIKEAHFSLFDNAIDAPYLTQDPIVSPLAVSAFFYYDFYFEQLFYDSLNNLIYEIKVVPKKDYEALLQGKLFIRGQTWELLSYDLQVNPLKLLYFKEMRITCDYEKKGEHVVPVRKEFVYTINGDKKNGLIRVLFNDYEFTVDDSKSDFWLESAVYKSDAFDKDSTYWRENRPFVLKDFEIRFIAEQDSAINYHKSDKFLLERDSVLNKISWFSLLIGSGYHHTNSFKKYSVSINGLFSQIIPFGVGGYRHRLNVNCTKEIKNGMVISVNPVIEYGFRNKDVKGYFGGSIKYNPLNSSTIGIKVGDNYELISTEQNITSTFAPVNRVRNQLFEANYSRELINGLYMRSTIHYSDRKSIDDKDYPEWVDYYTKYKTPYSFERYNILLTTIDLEYHIHQKYTIQKGKKLIYNSPWPTLYLTYKKAIPNLFSTVANFDFLELGVHDDIKLNSFGKTEFYLMTGAFLNKVDLRIIEHKFFRPSDKFFFSNPVNSLQILDTSLNTSNSYLQFNFIHHFNGFFLNKIWLINRLKLEETIGGATLFVPEAKFAHGELYVGIERRFRIRKEIFKIGAYAVTRSPVLSGSLVQFKIGFNLYNAFSDKWDY